MQAKRIFSSFSAFNIPISDTNVPSIRIPGRGMNIRDGFSCTISEHSIHSQVNVSLFSCSFQNRNLIGISPISVMHFRTLIYSINGSLSENRREDLALKPALKESLKVRNESTKRREYKNVFSNSSRY